MRSLTRRTLLWSLLAGLLAAGLSSPAHAAPGPPVLGVYPQSATLMAGDTRSFAAWTCPQDATGKPDYGPDGIPGTADDFCVSTLASWFVSGQIGSVFPPTGATTTLTGALPSGSTVETGSVIASMSGQTAAAGVTVTGPFSIPPATLTIVKDAVPNDAQDFVFSSSLGLPVTLDDDADATNPDSYTFVAFPSPAGTTYTVTESAASGWTLSSALCTGAPFVRVGPRTLSVFLTPNARATCTFVNTKLGRITVEKNTVPKSPQDFRFTLLPGGAEVTLDDDGDESKDVDAGNFLRSETFDNLSPRDDFNPYRLTEAPVLGWVVTGVTCRTEGSDTQADQPGPTALVPLGPGEHVICTFTNEPDSDVDTVADRLDRCPGTPLGTTVDEEGCAPGSITVVKDAVPDDPQNFSFDGNLAALGFVLEDADPVADDDEIVLDPPRSQDFGPLSPRSYAIRELVPPGWDLTKIECIADGDDPTPVGDVFLSDGLVTVELEQAQHVTCTFTNVKRGSITIVKDAVPNDRQDFDFTALGESFSLDDDSGAAGEDNVLSDFRTFADLRANVTYFLSEPMPPAVWRLVEIRCNGNSFTVDLATREAAVTLGPGESVTCTFVNFRPEAGEQHYLGYEVHRERPIFGGEEVLLTDQFGEERVFVETARMLLNPVEKRRQGRAAEPIQRPEDHLKCYRVTGGLRQDRDVRVSNQFTPGSTLHVKEPNRLCAPAAKALDGPPATPPADGQHYKCYRVEEDPPLMEERLELEDQFGVLRGVVRRAELLCNPVTKQRDGRGPEPPPRPEDHLVCYGIAEDVPFAPRIVFTRDQFITQRVRVFDPQVLCVPSTKVDAPSP